MLSVSPRSTPSETLGLGNPLPQLIPVWIESWNEWDWRVPSAEQIPDLQHFVNLADQCMSSETTSLIDSDGGADPHI